MTSAKSAEKSAAEKPAAPSAKPARSAKPDRAVMGLTARFAKRCFIAMVVCTVILICAYYVARAVLMSGWWYGDEPLYPLFSFINRNPEVTVLALSLVGWFIIFVWGLRQALRYLDDVARACEQLVGSSDAAIELPADLYQIEARLNIAKARAREAERQAALEAQRKNDLLVYLAHDLKTPLTSVIGYLRLLHDEPDVPLQVRQRYEGVALERAERLEDLINEFFEVARLNLSESSLSCAPVNLSRMVEQELFEYLPVMGEKGLTYQLDAEADLMVTCDVGKIERVFDNLLRNAVNYCDPNTQIDVRLAREERGGVPGARLRVTNRGNTIAPEQLERLFEQFYRLSSSRDSGTGGAGLGLAIARGLVQAHGGEIHAESSEGTVTFALWLPERPAAA